MICAKRDKEGTEVKIGGTTRDIILELCDLYGYILGMFKREGDEFAAEKLVELIHFQEMKEEQQKEEIKKQKEELLSSMEGPMEERERILNEMFEEVGGCHV